MCLPPVLVVRRSERRRLTEEVLRSVDTWLATSPFTTPIRALQTRHVTTHPLVFPQRDTHTHSYNQCFGQQGAGGGGCWFCYAYFFLGFSVSLV